MNATSLEIKKVSLNKVGFMDEALRSHKIEDEHVQQRADDIMERGLLNLPTITPSPVIDGEYVVTDGACRTMALKLLFSQGKWPEMQNFQIKPKQSVLETLADQIAGNVQTLKTTNKAYIQALFKLATEGKYKADELAKKAGMTKEYMFKLFKTLRLSEEILTLAEAGKVTISNLISLSDLSGKVDEEEMVDWVKKAEKATAKDFSIDVVKRLDDIRKEKAGLPKAEAVFRPVKKLLSKQELEALYIRCDNAFVEKPSKENEVRFNLMKEIFQFTEKDIEAQRQEYEQKKEEKEKAKEIRKEKRDADKLEEYKKKLEESGFSVEPVKAEPAKAEKKK